MDAQGKKFSIKTRNYPAILGNDEHDREGIGKISNNGKHCCLDITNHFEA